MFTVDGERANGLAPKAAFFSPQHRVGGAFSDGASQCMGRFSWASPCTLSKSRPSRLSCPSDSSSPLLSPSCFHLQFLQRAKVLARRLASQANVNTAPPELSLAPSILKIY